MSDRDEPLASPAGAPGGMVHDHEGRIRKLEEHERRRALDMAEARADIRDVRGTVSQLRFDLMGDPTRQDTAGKGALARVEQSVLDSEQRTSERLVNQTRELRRDLEGKTREVRDRLDEREKGSSRLRDRTWNVIVVTLAAALAFGSYLVIHFLPAAPIGKP